MELSKLLPTRRELLRDLSIGAVIAGAGGFVATKLFPSLAEGSEESAESGGTVTQASAAEIQRVTDNGAIALGPLGSRNLGTDHRFMSGETVTVAVPATKEIANSTTSIAGRTSEGAYGFGATQKGFGLYAHAPGFELDLNGTVTLQGGTLAHYTIRGGGGSVGSQYFALWQGSDHDLYSYFPDSLTSAVALLSQFDISDSVAGLSLSPKAATSGHSIQEESLLVEFGDYVADVKRAGNSDRPPWPGQTGVGGDFYSDGGGVLFVSTTAAVKIDPWQGSSVTDSDLEDLVAELRIDVG